MPANKLRNQDQPRQQPAEEFAPHHRFFAPTPLSRKLARKLLYLSQAVA